MDTTAALTAFGTEAASEPSPYDERCYQLRRALTRLRAMRRALLKRLVCDDDRIDVLGSLVLGYDLRPFHVDMLAYQSARHASLHLAPRGFGKSTVLNITRCIHEVLRDPNTRILIVSNTQLQAEVFLREVKHHFEHNARL